MAYKPLYKRAYELQAQYNARGIYYCYNQRNKYVYLGLLNAPICNNNTEGVQMTGYLIVYGGVVASENIDEWIESVKRNYKYAYKDNPEMLQYLDTID